jgi:DNA-binding NarL/FixJ family response regulator
MIAKGDYHSNQKEIQDKFTQRELEIIDFICKGLASKQIAGRLGLKPRTVERYRDAIMNKMHVNNSAAVVAFAMKNSLFKS